MHALLASATTLVSCSALLAAQEIQTLLVKGDVLGVSQKVGNVVDFSVNRQGTWSARVQNDAIFGQDLLLLDGSVLLAETFFGGSDFITAMQTADLDDAGAVVVGLDLSVSGGGLYYGGALALLAGDPVLPGTPWTGFGAVASSGEGSLLVRGRVDDPVVSGTQNEAFVLVTRDPASGAILAQSPVAVVGQPLGGLGAVTYLSPSRPSFAVNGSGQTIFCAGTAAGGGVVFVDGSALAMDGDPSPLPGFTWKSLSAARVDLNDAGDTVLQGQLAPAGEVIVVNGEPLVKLGSSLPVIVPYVLEKFGPAVRITSEGDVFWIGRWDDPDLDVDGGLFRNGELLVQEGISTAGGAVIHFFFDIFSPSTLGLEVSDDGRFVVFFAEINFGTDALLLLDLGSVERVDGCSGNPGVLARSAGLPVPGKTLQLALDAGQASGVSTFTAFSDAAAGSPCGVLVPGFGELLIDVTPAHLLLTMSGTPWTGAPVTFSVTLPPDPALAGLEIYAQGAFVDFAGSAPAESVRATNGLRIVLGQ